MELQSSTVPSWAPKSGISASAVRKASAVVFPSLPTLLVTPAAHSTPFIASTPLPGTTLDLFGTSARKAVEPFVFFGALPVRAAVGVLLVIYTVLLCLLECSTFEPLTLSVDEYVSITSFIVICYVVLLVAFFGLRRESASLLLPLLSFQIAAGTLSVVVFGHGTIMELVRGVPNYSFGCRLFLLVLLELTIAVLHLHSIRLVCSCYCYFSGKLQFEQEMFASEPARAAAAKKRLPSWVEDDDHEDDLIVFSKERVATNGNSLTLRKVRFEDV